jgi:hypothetical protein
VQHLTANYKPHAQWIPLIHGSKNGIRTLCGRQVYATWQQPPQPSEINCKHCLRWLKHYDVQPGTPTA